MWKTDPKNKCIHKYMCIYIPSIIVGLLEGTRKKERKRE
jgi:hypothetical protein